MPKNWALGAALTACAAMGLSACGGGGGGGSNVKPTPPPPVVDTSPMVVTTDLAVASGQAITRPIVLDAGADLDNQGAIGGVDIGVEAKAPSIITNHGGGTIRGTTTAIRLDHGGEIHNGVGSTIEATGAGGTDCGANTKCAIYVGVNNVAQPGQAHFVLENAGTIIGNVQLDEAGLNDVRLTTGGSIRGDLRIGSGDGSSLTLNGSAGTSQRYSQAVTGSTAFNGLLVKSGDGAWIIDSHWGRPSRIEIDGGSLQVADGGPTDFTNPHGTDDLLPIRMRHGELVFNRSDDVDLRMADIYNEGTSTDDGILVQAGTGTLSLSPWTRKPKTLRIERGTVRIRDDGNNPQPGVGWDIGGWSYSTDFENDGALVFDTDSSLAVRGRISGSGSVTQDGNGVLHLLSGSLNGTPENSYTGGTTINHGMLWADNLMPGSLVVNEGGTVGVTIDVDGSVGYWRTRFPGVERDFANAGLAIVATADSPVGGNYVQSSTGTLAVNLGSKLVVAGTASIEGTLLVIGANLFSYVANAHTEVLTAAGGVNGTFDRLAKAAGVVFTSNTIHYDANSVWLDTTGLDITQAAAGDGIGYTPASMTSAVRVQGAFEQLDERIATGSLDGVSGDFLHAAGRFQSAPSIAAAQASLRSLSGQLHAASAAMTFRAIDAGNQALSGRLDGVRAGSAAIGMWTQQLGGNGSMARSGFDGVGYQLNGWLVGNDYRIGRNAVAGFAFGQGMGVQQLQHGADRDDSRRTEGMVYAGLTGDRWYAQGRVGFGHIRQLVDRQLLLGDVAEGVWTRYDGRYQAAYGESGLRFGLGNLRIAPFASVEYARSDRDAFTEEGAGGFGLRSDAQALSRWQASLGLRATRRWDFGHGRTLDFGAHAQWRRAFAASDDAMDASFVGLQQWSPLAGIGLSRYGSLFGFGVDAQLSPRAALKLSYDYERGQYESAQGMTAALNVAF